jgi:hypothetical protein
MNFVSQSHIYFRNSFQISVNLYICEATPDDGTLASTEDTTAVQTNKSGRTAGSLHIYQPSM